MLVLCDTFDYSDHPVYTHTDEECMERYREPGDMLKVMEVYDLRSDKHPQLAMQRCFNLPHPEQENPT